MPQSSGPEPESYAGPTKLDPYHPLIQEQLTTYPELSAVRLFAECRAAGYPGGYSQVKALVARGYNPAFAS